MGDFSGFRFGPVGNCGPTVLGVGGTDFASFPDFRLGRVPGTARFAKGNQCRARNQGARGDPEKWTGQIWRFFPISVWARTPVRGGFHKRKPMSRLVRAKRTVKGGDG